MEGTRLTIQAMPRPQGHVFSIRTPGTPERFKQFDKELSFVWDKLSAMAAESDFTPAGLSAQSHSVLLGSLERVFDKCLSFYFYWVNFGCLSRGTAACGVVALHSLLLAFNLQLPSPFPKGVQLDWEAITTPSCDDFVAKAKCFFPVASLAQVDLASFPEVSTTIPSLRALIRCCNMGIDD